MSMEDMRKVTCPECGHEYDFKIWNSLNVSLDPELKEQLLSGELFMFRCEECGHSAMISYPMLYHDMDEGLMIQLVLSEEEVDNARTALRESVSMTREALGLAENAPESSYIYRIVTSQTSLREKILIFDRGRDDRLVELTKVFLGGVLHDQQPELNDFALYYECGDIAGDGNDDNEFFVVAGLEGVLGYVPFQQAMYDELSGVMGDKLPDIKSGGEMYITTKWAADFMKEMDE